VAFHIDKLTAQYNYLDKERKRIAADLHDDLGASLSTLKLRLQLLKSFDPADALIVETCEQQIDNMMQKLRHISFNIMPGVLQRQGLNEALDELTDMIAHSSKIKIEYRNSVASFEKSKSVHIYYIVREIINNIVKHSNANAASIHIDKIKNTIQLVIKDNGIGFDKDAVLKNGTGMGLHNISARADLLKARVYLTTGKNKGVDFLIRIPLT
jgi:signal transduction histidine kinase